MILGLEQYLGPKYRDRIDVFFKEKEIEFDKILPDDYVSRANEEERKKRYRILEEIRLILNREGF